MNLFNLLCINDNKNSFEEFILSILPIVSIILLVYGVIQICMNLGNKDNGKLKRGTVAFLTSIILIVISIFLMNIKSNNLNDACGNVSPLYSLTKAIINIAMILVPISFIVMSFIRIIRWFFCKDKNTKKELGQEIIRFLAIALLIFSMMMTIGLLIDTFVDVPKTDVWATCWCK